MNRRSTSRATRKTHDARTQFRLLCQNEPQQQLPGLEVEFRLVQ
jgi:hypothetical protein